MENLLLGGVVEVGKLKKQSGKSSENSDGKQTSVLLVRRSEE